MALKVEMFKGVCHKSDGQPLYMKKKEAVPVNVVYCGVETELTFTDVYFADEVKHILISYGIVDRKGCTLGYKVHNVSSPKKLLELRILMINGLETFFWCRVA